MSDNGDLLKPNPTERPISGIKKIVILPDELGYVDNGITTETLKLALYKPNDAFGIDLITDGIVTFQANKYNLEEDKLYIASPGVGRRLGEIVYDRVTGVVSKFHLFFSGEVVKGLISQSESPIIKELIHLLPYDDIQLTELNRIREISDIGENEAVIVDKEGTATILSANTTSDRTQVKVTGQRQGVNTIQTDGLRYCGAVYVDVGNEFKVLLHGRGNETYERLLDKCLQMIERAGASMNNLHFTLVRSSQGAISAGSGLSYLAYEEYLEKILRKYGRKEKITLLDTNSVSIDLQSEIILERPKKQF